MNRFLLSGLSIIAIAMTVASPANAADTISDGQWFHSYLRTSEAHKLTQGDGVNVAIVDSGVDAEHPDLASSVVSGIDFTTSGDGSVDTGGHGTRMAGLVAAHGRVTGVAPKAIILPSRVQQTRDGGSSVTAQGILWAAQHGAKVISVSISGDHRDSRLEFAVQEAAKADAVVVAAVGNLPDSKAVEFPAGIPGVLAVASVGKDGNRAPNSVTGPEVMIAAPGNDISSTTLNGGYAVTSGTSNATAIVAGAVALVRARYPQLKAQEVIRRITATATDKGTPGRDPEYGYGVLNLVGALTAALPDATTAAPANSPITTSPTSEAPEENRFPLWLIAIPAIVMVAAAGFFVLKRRRN